MNKYGETALQAMKLMADGECSPLNAWERAASEVFAGLLPSANKGCPREAFLGLHDLRITIGPPSAAITHGSSRKRGVNREYAALAVKALFANHTLAAAGPLQLWKTVLAAHGADPDKEHNSQMDVVLALWDRGFISIGKNP